MYRLLVITHKLVSHEYFLNKMDEVEAYFAMKYLEYADVVQWDQVRNLMLSPGNKYCLKNHNVSVKDFFPLPIDEKEEKKVKHTEIDKQAEALFLKLKGEQ